MGVGIIIQARPSESLSTSVYTGDGRSFEDYVVTAIVVELVSPRRPNAVGFMAICTSDAVIGSPRGFSGRDSLGREVLGHGPLRRRGLDFRGLAVPQGSSSHAPAMDGLRASSSRIVACLQDRGRTRRVIQKASEGVGRMGPDGPILVGDGRVSTTRLVAVA